MIEILLKNHLENSLNKPVYLVLPNEKPKIFVTIEKLRGSYNNQLKSSVFAVQSWGDSLYTAAILNEDVKKNINKLVENKEVSKIKINSDYNFTDEETKKYRYQSVIEIWHY